jgi:protein-disulfide isomerase
MPPRSDESYAASPAKSNPWFAISIGLVGVIAGYIAGTSFTAPLTAGGTAQVAQQQASVPSAAVVPDPQPTGTAPATGVGPVIGDSKAEITLVEFTDFQCPFCSRHYNETFGQIKQNYVDTGKVKYEIRNYPLSFHPNAEIGAEAAMCAQKQNKFWEMHDKLFSAQDEWVNLDNAGAVAKYKTYAAAIGLNAADFATCIDTHATKSVIQKDITDAAPAGIDGTPGFWIIGPGGKTKQISGAYPYATFQAAFDEMLKS